MSFKKLLMTGLISTCVIASTLSAGYAQNITHKVQQGDTFWIISNKYGISVDSLLKANNATENTVLYTGSTIQIPVSSTTTIHTVAQGETYWTIHKKYNVDFEKLLEANNADENTMLSIGDKVIIHTKVQPSQPTQPPEQLIHTAQSGDTYWTIHKKYNIAFDKLLEANDANEDSTLSIGDKVVIPAKNQPIEPVIHTVKSGDTFWTISQKYRVDFYELLDYNNANENSQLYVGQKVKIPLDDTSSNTPDPEPQPEPSKPYITYTKYTVQRDDDIWGLAIKFGIPAPELASENGLKETVRLRPGTILKVPVHHIPVKSTPGPKYGELLDWWTEARYFIPVGSDFEVVDFYTGKSFKARRTTGSNHADCEALSIYDTKRAKEIWGNSFSWTRRPVIIKFNGRKIAASASMMPHAGNDYSPGGIFTSWRSAGYGPGYNLDWIKNNGMVGHFDIHYLNSTRHKDGRIDTRHQQNIKISGGK